jgi:hypothetical protein
MAALCLAPQSASAAAYTPADYKLNIYSVQIRDISHRINPEKYCADIYGTINMTDGFSAGGYAFFWAERKDAVKVCEPNRPANEGTQSGTLNASTGGTTAVTSTFSGDKTKDRPFTITLDLWNRNSISRDQQLIHKTVSVWPPERYAMVPLISDAPADGTVYLRYDIINLTETEQQEKIKKEQSERDRKTQGYSACRGSGRSHDECVQE